MKRLPGRPVMASPVLRLVIAKELCRTRSIKAAAFNCNVSYAVARKIFLEDIDVEWRIKPEKRDETAQVQGYLPFK